MTFEEDDRSLLGTYWDGVAGGVCVGLTIATFGYLGWHLFLAVTK